MYVSQTFSRLRFILVPIQGFSLTGDTNTEQMEPFLQSDIMCAIFDTASWLRDFVAVLQSDDSRKVGQRVEALARPRAAHAINPTCAHR